MKQQFLWLLRFIIILCIWLPIFVPAIENEQAQKKLLPVQVLVPHDIFQDFTLHQKVVHEVRKILDTKYSLDLRPYGSKNDPHPAYTYNNLVQQIREAKGLVVVIASNHLWGPAAQQFISALKNTQAYQNQEIFWLDAEQIYNQQQEPQRFLVINDLYVPSHNFLGNTTNINIHIVGFLEPREKLSAEIIVREGESVLNTHKVTLEANSLGIVNTFQELPIFFIKAGMQTLSVSLNAKEAFFPLNHAATTTYVSHNKAIVLHIAYSPDWTLRTLRQKLKFWPNLDLVSFYILRSWKNITLSNTEDELGLIAFPTDSLFEMDKIQNFHGIVIQNFPIENHIYREQHILNIIQYVREGGRILLFAGPRSSFVEHPEFASSDFWQTQPTNMELTPCTNMAKFEVSSQGLAWKPTEKLMYADDFAKQIEKIETAQNVLYCKPKDSVIPLATVSHNGEEHPILLAQSLGKGLVVYVLGSDWLMRHSQISSSNVTQKQKRIEIAQASEYLFEWFVDFLLRRQDAGLRPPDLAGPRLYAADQALFVKFRGIRYPHLMAKIYDNTKLLAKGEIVHLDDLNMNFLQLEKPLIEDLKDTESIAFVTKNLALELDDKESSVKRTSTWNIFYGNTQKRETLPNPMLFADIPRFEEIPQTSIPTPSRDVQKNRAATSLIEAYPFLLALTLLLLACEQFLSHILWRKNV